jgi:hypothetical protein
VTTAEELAQVEAAITAILTGGQAHASEGRALTRASLGDLYARKGQLVALLAQETRGSAVTYGVPTN